MAESKDVILIGAGVLSTTFGSMLNELEPSGISSFMNVWIDQV